MYLRLARYLAVLDPGGYLGTSKRLLSLSYADIKLAYWKYKIYREVISFFG